MNDYSQNGEGKILYEILSIIPDKKNFVVEFGAGDGYWFSNTRGLIELGWDSLQMDGISEPKNNVKQEFITKENINDLFKKYNVPHEFDLLSIDIDGNDYWVWESLEYSPSVVIIEYNSNFDLNESYTLRYNPSHNFHTDGNAFGASLIALKKLGESKGYFLHLEVNYMNLIFIKNQYKHLFSEIDLSTVQLPLRVHRGKQIEYFTNI